MNEAPPPPPLEPATAARLHARPTSGPRPAATSGQSSIRLTNGRDALLYVPARYRPDVPAALVVSLHGAGSTAERGMAIMAPLADEFGTIIFAPQSSGPTWDVLSGFGPDVAAIDAALADIVLRYTIAPARYVLAGFSDGASYALSLGLSNGDIVTHIISFSSGFMFPAGLMGMPRIFMSHGTNDPMLGIDMTGRIMSQQLDQVGYDVRYLEFEGVHTVPDDIRRAAFEWLFDRG